MTPPRPREPPPLLPRLSVPRALLLGALVGALLLSALLARALPPPPLLLRRAASSSSAATLWPACAASPRAARALRWPPSSSPTLLSAESVPASWAARESRVVRANCAAFSAYVPDGRMLAPARDGAAGEEPVFLAWANPELVMHMAEFYDSLESGAWERTTLLLLRALLEREGGASGDFSYVDFGAWIGPTALFAANFAPRVLALEPHPRPAAIFAANLFALPANAPLAARTRLFRECIASDTGTQTLLDDSGGDSSRSRLAAAAAAATHSGGRRKDEQDERSVSVPCRTLPHFVRDEGARNLRLVKMDVEGAELRVFPSMRGWLKALDDGAVEAELRGDADGARGKPAFLLSVHPAFWGAAPAEQELLELWATIALFRFVYEGAALRDRSAAFREGSVVREDQLRAVRQLNMTELVLVDEELPPLV
jgi:FkbM family methyltransferase